MSVFSVEPRHEMQRFLAEQQVVVDWVYQVSPASYGLRGTPTLLVVDGGGIVRRVFFGALDKSRQEEFLEIIRTGAL